MKLTIQVSIAADLDVQEIANYILMDNSDAGMRFIPAVHQTLEGLAEFPGKGSRKFAEGLELSGLRSYGVDGFPNHLIFYRVEPENVLQVLAVIRGARDWVRLLRRRR